MKSQYFKIIKWGAIDRENHTAEVTVKFSWYWVLWQMIKIKLGGIR